MRIEFFSDGAQDCPLILFYGCPSAGAESVINSFRSLAEEQEKEIALHEISGVTSVGNIEVFATNAKGRAGVRQLSPNCFRWRQDREGWLQVAELAEPVVQGGGFQYLENEGKVRVIISEDRAW